MATIKPISVPAKRLSQTITGSASSFKLDNILGWDGVTNLAASDFGTKAYVAFRNAAGTLIEFMEIDPSTIASASITITRRGLKYNGDDLTTEVSANKLTWVKGDTIVELGTHMPQLLAHYVDIIGDQTVAGVKTFSSIPVLPSTAPTSATHAANKAYVDLIGTGSAVYDQNIVPGTAGENVVAGDWVYFKTSDQKWWKTDADASATSLDVKIGVAQATILADATGNFLIGGLEKNQSGLTAGATYYLSGTAGGISTTPGAFIRFVGRAKSTTQIFHETNNDITILSRLGSQIYAASSAGSDTYAITLSPALTAYVTGMVIQFKTDVANTGAATLNVNGLGAISIKKNSSAALATNDILAGQIVTVVYDGTNFQMQSQLGNPPASSKFGGDGTDGALSITSGATNIDLGNALVVTKNYTSISITGTGSLTFSNPHANGTIIILKSQGEVTLTSSAAPMIAANALGAAGGASGTDGTIGTGIIYETNKGLLGAARESGGLGGGAGGVASSGRTTIDVRNAMQLTRTLRVSCGAGGGGGGIGHGPVAGGAGGRGGGALVIECAGAFNFTTASGISVAGANGSVGTVGGVNLGGAGGGGGGAGGTCVILYGTLTANSGTITVSGGTGGTGGAGNNGSGGAGGAGGAGGNGMTGTSNGGAGGAGGASSSTSNAGGGGGGSGGASDFAGDAGSTGSGGTGAVNYAGGGGGGGGASGWSLVAANTSFV